MDSRKAIESLDELHYIDVICTRRPSGLYMLNKREPNIAEIGNTGKYDVYTSAGEEIGFTVCEFYAAFAFGVKDLPVLESVPVRMWGERARR
jgi:hypothetical protein